MLPLVVEPEVLLEEVVDEDDVSDLALDCEEEVEEEEEMVELEEVAVGQVGKELKKLLLLPVSHQEPELIPRRLMARKPSSDEMVGKAVAVDADSAKMAIVICWETFMMT